jgi:hypothetical protein
MINIIAKTMRIMAVFASEPNTTGMGPMSTTPPPLIDFRGLGLCRDCEGEDVLCPCGSSTTSSSKVPFAKPKKPRKIAAIIHRTPIKENNPDPKNTGMKTTTPALPSPEATLYPSEIIPQINKMMAKRWYLFIYAYLPLLLYNIRFLRFCISFTIRAIFGLINGLF